MNYFRHQLCYLDPQTKPLSTHSKEELGMLAYWLKEQYPLIITRQPVQVPEASLHLALPFFDLSHQKKIRLSYVFAKTAIKTTQDLPTFNQLFPQIRTSIKLHVYGSYCWQQLTGHSYVHDSSDLDLLIIYAQQSLDELKALYHYLTQELKTIPIDGEIRFPNLGDCSWLELIQAETSPSILIKSLRELSLINREHLYAQFPTLLA